MKKVRDFDKFILITVFSHRPYKVLYVEIPTINQIQRLGQTNSDDKWIITSRGYRTVREKLSKIWTCEIKIEELSNVDFCPECLDIQISTKMLEDNKFRKLQINNI